MKVSHFNKYQALSAEYKLDENFHLKKGLNTHVAGSGRSGQAAVKFLHALGMNVTLHEKDPSKIPNDFMTFLEKNSIPYIGGEHKKEYFKDCDVLIPSPGIHASAFTDIFKKMLSEGLDKRNLAFILSETELAWLYCKDIPLLAITGTSGKTTTTTLCSAMLKESGLRVFTGGNIGTPLCEFAIKYIQDSEEGMEAKKTEVIVLELSSAQLQTSHLLRPQVAICLNITENHMDYHANMDEYISAKMDIFKNQNEEDIAILGETLRAYHPALQSQYPIKGKIIFFDSSIARFPDTKLIGMHNQSNAEAAWQACHSFGVTEEEASMAMQKVAPMENRLEHVATINGVTYINDSKGTTVDALKVALQAVAEAKHPICLLLGGKFKGGNLASLLPLMKENVKHIALFGGSKEIFMEAFGKDFQNTISWDETLKQAILRLQDIVQDKDAVLLSPATSSFDQYQNYEMRGEDFRQIVKNLQKS